MAFRFGSLLEVFILPDDSIVEEREESSNVERNTVPRLSPRRPSKPRRYRRIRFCRRRTSLRQYVWRKWRGSHLLALGSKRRTLWSRRGLSGCRSLSGSSTRRAPSNKISRRAYSHFDEIFPTHRIRRSAAPWMFKRSPVDIRYDFRGNWSSLAEYLSRNPVTGLLIAKDDQILCEHYLMGVPIATGSVRNRW